MRSPSYRDDKRGTTLQMLPDLLKGHQGARLSARTDRTAIQGPQALLVSNDPYAMTDVAGLGRRPRLDAAQLGVVAVLVNSAAQAAGLVRRGHGTGLTVLTTEQVTVDADAPEIPVGIDGETVMMPTPVRCTIRPGALRVVVPRNRPGVPTLRQPLEWQRLKGSRPSAVSQRASLPRQSVREETATVRRQTASCPSIRPTDSSSMERRPTQLVEADGLAADHVERIARDHSACAPLRTR